jgi:hypothetical protein
MIALAVAIAITMTGCDALDAMLNFNMFASLAAVDAKEIADADAATLVELSDSDSFYDTLADDAALKAETLTKIDNAIGASIDSAADQELAVLAANIELQTTPAWDLINNVSSLVTDLINGTTPDASALEDTIRSLVPDSVMSADGSINEVAFVAMIDALVSADGVYRDLGEAVGLDGYASDADINAGEIAQNALIAAMIGAVNPVSGTTGEYLYDLLTNPLAAEPTSAQFSFPIMDSGTDPANYLGNILTAAGISF